MALGQEGRLTMAYGLKGAQMGAVGPRIDSEGLSCLTGP